MATQSKSIERVVPARETISRDQMKRQFTNSGIFAILLMVTILWLIPLAWALDTALKPESETTIFPLTWLSSHFTLQAFASTLSTSDLPRWYFIVRVCGHVPGHYPATDRVPLRRVHLQAVL